MVGRVHRGLMEIDQLSRLTQKEQKQNSDHFGPSIANVRTPLQVNLGYVLKNMAGNVLTIDVLLF